MLSLSKHRQLFLPIKISKNMLKDLVNKNRSYRRFYQDHKIPYDLLKELINLARLSPSGRNLQPLKYFLSADEQTNANIYSTLSWAAYLKDWAGPEEGEKPTAYIVILGDTQLTTNFMCDHGIVSQSILLGAVEKGLGGCIFASINKAKLKELIKLDDHLEILLVIALGKPKEIVIVEEVKNNDIKYYRDEKQVHHVPKRSLDELILNKKDPTV
jgi:nitroreductase